MPSLRLIALVLAATLLPAAGARAAAWTPEALHASGTQLDLAASSGGAAALAFVDAHGVVRVAARSAGAGWQAVPIVSRGNVPVTGPSAGVSSSGEVIVAWAQAGPSSAGGTIRGPLTIRAAIRSRSGHWSVPRTIGTSGHFTAAETQVSVNPRGDAIVLWRGVQRRDGRHRNEALQSAYRAAGHQFGHAQTISEPERPRGVSGGRIVLGDRGTATAVWTNDRGPVVRIATRTAGPSGHWGTPRVLGGAPASQPVIALAKYGGVTVAWHQAGVDSEGNGLQSGALLTADRRLIGTLTKPQTISATPTRDQALAISPAGEALLSFSAGSGTALRLAVRAPGAAKFGAPQVLSGVVPSNGAAKLAYLPDGTAVLLWSDAARDVLVSERAPGGDFGAPQQIGTNGSSPRLVVATRAVAVWGSPAGDALKLTGATRG